jgi:hypothetical protein
LGPQLRDSKRHPRVLATSSAHARIEIGLDFTHIVVKLFCNASERLNIKGVVRIYSIA